MVVFIIIKIYNKISFTVIIVIIYNNIFFSDTYNGTDSIVVDGLVVVGRLILWLITS